METEEPYIGQIVHYYPSRIQSEHYAAIVVQAGVPRAGVPRTSDSFVHLRVFFGDGSQSHMKSVSHRRATSDGECWDTIENRSCSPSAYQQREQ